MKKRKLMNTIDNQVRQNPVAKFAHRLNKSQAFLDKTRYTRKLKHNKPEVFPIIPTTALLEKPPVCLIAA